MVKTLMFAGFLKVSSLHNHGNAGYSGETTKEPSALAKDSFEIICQILRGDDLGEDSKGRSLWNLTITE